MIKKVFNQLKAKLKKESDLEKLEKLIDDFRTLGLIITKTHPEATDIYKFFTRAEYMLESARDEVKIIERTKNVKKITTPVKPAPAEEIVSKKTEADFNKLIKELEEKLNAEQNSRTQSQSKLY